MTAGYLLDNREPAAGRRFAAMSALFDPATFRRISALGIAAGWRVWEVGAGGDNVPRWLGAQVGASGRVLATDLDTTWMDAGALAPLDGRDSLSAVSAAERRRGVIEVRRHDVAADPPPAEQFDLVHARLVLVHIVDRDAALRSMVATLAPGGWLLIEDADPALQPLAHLDAIAPEHALANHIRTGFRALLAERGAELGFGRTLPRRLRAAGLVDVRAEAQFPVAMPELASLELATIEMLRSSLVAKGHATDDEVERHVANVAAGRVEVVTAPMIAAWGRRH